MGIRSILRSKGRAILDLIARASRHLQVRRPKATHSHECHSSDGQLGTTTPAALKGNATSTTAVGLNAVGCTRPCCAPVEVASRFESPWKEWAGAIRGTEDVIDCMKRLGLPTTLSDRERAPRRSKGTTKEKSACVRGVTTPVAVCHHEQTFPVFEDWYTVLYGRHDETPRDEYDETFSLSLSANGVECDMTPAAPAVTTISAFQAELTYCTATQHFAPVQDGMSHAQPLSPVSSPGSYSTIQHSADNNEQEALDTGVDEGRQHDEDDTTTLELTDKLPEYTEHAWWYHPNCVIGAEDPCSTTPNMRRAYEEFDAVDLPNEHLGAFLGAVNAPVYNAGLGPLWDVRYAYYATDRPQNGARCVPSGVCEATICGKMATKKRATD